MAIGGHHNPKAGTVTWLTPPSIIDALGGPESFDLDPCAALNQPWPTARQHYTIEDDGLAQPWQGRVWLNPPYSSGVIGKWMNKLVSHGRGISLIFARTETQAFHKAVWREADALLFMEGRINFHDAQGIRAAKNAGAPSVFCAYGVDDADILSQCGIPGCFVPLKFRTLVFGFAAVGTWIDEVMKVMECKGAAASLDDIYRSMADNPKAQRNQHWKAKIRQTLQKGPFEPVRKGVWKLSQGELF